jgi:drug/metabolite transporter (DMT)-like permease
MAALLALGSSVIWGSADFLGGLLTRTRSAYVVVAASQAFGLLAIALVALVTGDWRASLGYLPWAVGAGLSGALGLVCYYAGLSSGTMGVVAPIASMGAIVPVALGIAGGEHPSWVQLVGIVLALLGVAAASGPELSGGAAVGGRRPVLLAAIAGCAFGFALYAIGRGTEHNGVMTLVAMRASTVGLFVIAALVLRTTGGIKARDLGPLAAVGIGDVVANLMFAVSTTKGLLSISSALTSFYPVVTVMLARWVLAERLRAVQWVGVGLALGGVAMISAG